VPSGILTRVVDVALREVLPIGQLERSCLRTTPLLPHQAAFSNRELRADALGQAKRDLHC
jgi:hypothetical protein